MYVSRFNRNEIAKMIKENIFKYSCWHHVNRLVSLVFQIFVIRNSNIGWHDPETSQRSVRAGSLVSDQSGVNHAIFPGHRNVVFHELVTSDETNMKTWLTQFRASSSCQSLQYCRHCLVKGHSGLLKIFLSAAKYVSWKLIKLTSSATSAVDISVQRLVHLVSRHGRSWGNSLTTWQIVKSTIYFCCKYFLLTHRRWGRT